MLTKKRLIMTIFFLIVFLMVGTAYSGGDDCLFCGMKRSQFGHSWVVLEHDDTTFTGVCSVHCAAIYMALHTGEFISRITVGDYNTQKQIDADNAFWVIGGDKIGVMTTRAKWAFETKEAADDFMRKHGGRPSTFNETLKASFEDMYEDILMIQKKRIMMKIKKSL